MLIGALSAAGVLTPLVAGALTVAAGGLGAVASLALIAFEDRAKWAHLVEFILFTAAAVLGTLLLLGHLQMAIVSYCALGIGGAGLLLTGAGVFIRA